MQWIRGGRDRQAGPLQGAFNSMQWIRGGDGAPSRPRLFMELSTPCNGFEEEMELLVGPDYLWNFQLHAMDSDLSGLFAQGVGR
jgi:hypothetical protein